jgi:hypothetical protein
MAESNEIIETHPVQRGYHLDRERAECPKVVTMRAYEVYCKVYSPQEDLITGNCRGGFGVSELIGFLYAHTFPENEWRTRFDEAITRMKYL